MFWGLKKKRREVASTRRKAKRVVIAEEDLLSGEKRKCFGKKSEWNRAYMKEPFHRRQGLGGGGEIGTRGP